MKGAWVVLNAFTFKCFFNIQAVDKEIELGKVIHPLQLFAQGIRNDLSGTNKCNWEYIG